MKKILMVAALGIVAAGAHAQSMMKAGLWEIRVVRQVSDGRDMTAQIAGAQAEMQKMMASMSPAQRKQMEAMMGKQAAPASDVQRICVSAEMAARDRPAMPAEAGCEPANISRSGSRTSFDINCKPEGRTVVGKGESVLAGDMITTRLDMVMTDARGRHTIQNESQARYLGPDCQGIKPADQIARELREARQR